MNHEKPAIQNPEATIRELIEALVLRQGAVWNAGQPALKAAVRALDVERARALANDLWARYSENDDIVWFLGQLNASNPGALASVWSELVARDMLWPGWLYLGAPPEITERLLRLIDGPMGSLRRSHLLLALAWIGDDRVVAQFQAWRENPPPWREELHIPPHEYAAEAGWELTPDGGKRLLYWTDCYELVPGAQPVDSADASDADVGTCGWCGRPLAALLDIDLRDPRLAFLAGQVNPDTIRLRIAHCLWCTGYATTYTDIDLRGGSAWSAANGAKPPILERVGNGQDDWLMPDLRSFRLVPGAPRETPFEALGHFMLSEGGVSQLGGHPEWIQDAEYPHCPSCGQRMKCAGQVSWEDVPDGAEGSTYAFVCLPCGKAATSYQQT